METQYANVHRGLHWMSERTTEAYEAARDAVAALMNAPRPARDRVHPQQHRGAQPGRAQLRPRRAEAGPGGGDLGHGAPFQHRPLADAARRAWHRAAGRADHRRRRARHGGVRGAAGRRQGRAWSPITHMSNVLGTYTPAERIARIAHAHGAKVLFDGSQAIVHRARRRAGDGRRFLRLHRAQAVRPHRHRRAVGAARAAGGDAAVPRRRRNDFLGHATNAPPGPRCRTSSRPGRRRSWKASASRRRSITSQRHRLRRRSRRTRRR